MIDAAKGRLHNLDVVIRGDTCIGGCRKEGVMKSDVGRSRLYINRRVLLQDEGNRLSQIKYLLKPYGGIQNLA